MEGGYTKRELREWVRRRGEPAIVFASHGAIDKVNSAVHTVLHPEKEYLPDEEKVKILDAFLHSLVLLLTEGDVRGYNIPLLGMASKDVTYGDYGRRAEIVRYYTVDRGKVLNELKRLAKKDDDLALAVSYLKRYYVGREDRNRAVNLVHEPPTTRLGAAVQYLYHTIALLVAEELGLTRWRHVVTYHGGRLERARKKLREGFSNGL